ncbi:efflux RND transporter permease subunit [Cytophagaceae bacterium YF14B1]|uniref:Efflux RND transporter permease subunit n=1 Tax=Xanthocytophaga flava TaxID=3048013 RepID=A0AAE3QPN2_9BACT|nr:efflux RND transporter permease subunit [Xanthocytophaga flavus]MDJ1481235.1 efflux RND transporter permease subunit [Xanthocytophaga flavus]
MAQHTHKPEIDQEEKFKRFKPTEWFIENKTTMYVMTAIISLVGFFTYSSLPKENFPDIVLPQFTIQTVQFGTSPADVENIITKHIEKQLKSVKNVKKVTSTSLEGFSLVIVEFNTGISISDAKDLVRDAVDKARPDLPTKLDQEPQIQEIELSEIPIMNINLAGNYPLHKLKDYAEDMEDAIEELPEINRVDIVGALEREFQVNVDIFKMQAAGITFNDINQAVAAENINISGGELNTSGVRRTLRVAGEFKNVQQIENVIVRSARGNAKFLKEIADVADGFKEKQDYARLDGKTVITLNVIKRGGENLISASEKIEELIKDFEEHRFPEGLSITVTGDTSERTKNTLNDLIATVILGFIFVVFVLMFFMGTTDAFFVGLSVPLSSLMAFLIISIIAWINPDLKFTLNTVVMFAFLLALGIVVDDAIVVIENTHRIFHDENLSIKQAAKKAAGEVFAPVLSGTLVNVAPFIPLLFWPGIVGEFMKYLPITLIATLFASLFVAFVMNPVFAVDFMKNTEDHKANKGFKPLVRPLIIMAVLAVLGYMIHVGAGNFMLFVIVLYVANHYLFNPMIFAFQDRFLPKLKNGYRRLLSFALIGYRSWLFILASIVVLVISFVVTGIMKPKVIFFPSGEPDFVYVYNKLPVGTDAAVTDSITRIIEKRIAEVTTLPNGHRNPVIQSIITNVGVNAGDPQNAADRQPASYKSKITIAFVDLNERIGVSTTEIMEAISAKVKGIPGTEISVERERNGPQTGKPISIEIAGEDFNQLLKIEKEVRDGIKKNGIEGIENLKSDLVMNKPEIIIDIDKEKAEREGISTQTIALFVRTALFGAEATKFRDNKDEYPVQIRVKESQRKQIETLLAMQIGYMDIATGGFRQIPLNSVANIHYGTTFSGINRKDQERLITLGSEVMPGYNANEIVGAINSQVLSSLTLPEGYSVKTAGEQEDQKETQDFLTIAFLTAVGLMFFIMVLQFNSITKPVIIFATIVFSLIGILLGFSLTGMTISIIMTGVGFIALAGIVVKNGIILMEFIEELRMRGEDLKTAIVDGGATRLTPVILTASAAILGLIPLGVGLNVDFAGLFTRFNPNIFIGGESSVFWGPLAWTIIFGLLATTFLTLVIVPCMYYNVEKIKDRFLKKSGGRRSGVVTHTPATEVPAE